ESATRPRRSRPTCAGRLLPRDRAALKAIAREILAFPRPRPLRKIVEPGVAQEPWGVQALPRVVQDQGLRLAVACPESTDLLRHLSRVPGPRAFVELAAQVRDRVS